MGRFLTRDTWPGEVNRPLSLNRWGYVEANPVNFVDPTGHSPRFSPRILCQMMPSKAMYERCVGTIYGIEPINYFGEFVDGKPGCYKGPEYYRAPGYFKGTGITIAYPWIVNWRFAVESVYDFATFQHGYFTNGADWAPIVLPGVGVSDFVWGGILEQYGGIVYGFRTDTSILRDYPGWAVTGFLGASAGPAGADPFGPSIGTGRGSFRSLADFKIRGEGVYVNVGFGVDAFPTFLDAGFGLIHMTQAPLSTVTPYKYADNTINREKLFTDILFGKHNVWITDIESTAYSLGFPERMTAALASIFYGLVYEDITSDYE
jgi:hypothetical protein